MTIFKHVVQQPFVTATGAAALFHSTWALATLFSGEQPQNALSLAYAGWLIPALLIAFAMDVGQIATSHEIRVHGLTVSRAITFVVFAVATYYLQWLYMAHHMPALELAPGVRATWSDVATLFRDAAVWLIPALLPLSTLLYTFSGRPKPSADIPSHAAVVSIAPMSNMVEQPIGDLPLLSYTGEFDDSLPVQEFPAVFVEVPTPLEVPQTLNCKACGKDFGIVQDPEKAKKVLAGHSQHCTKQLANNGHSTLSHD